MKTNREQSRNPRKAETLRTYKPQLIIALPHLAQSLPHSVRFLIQTECKATMPHNTGFYTAFLNHELSNVNGCIVFFQSGVILRDSHGVAQVRYITGNKILRILKAKGTTSLILLVQH